MSEAGRRVRVCDYDRVEGFREESPDFSRGQAAGHPFFGSFLWSEQRNEHTKVFEKIVLYPFFACPKKGYPQERAPPSHRGLRLPSTGT